LAFIGYCRYGRAEDTPPRHKPPHPPPMMPWGLLCTMYHAEGRDWGKGGAGRIEGEGREFEEREPQVHAGRLVRLWLSLHGPPELGYCSADVLARLCILMAQDTRL